MMEQNIQHARRGRLQHVPLTPDATRFDEPERASVRFGHDVKNKPDASAYRLIIRSLKSTAIALTPVRASTLQHDEEAVGLQIEQFPTLRFNS
jgi:hypothetical protein